jgi:ubiquinone/menaquinone biosynthesis C-methylase UbiE
VTYFRKYLVGWVEAYQSLLEKQFLSKHGAEYVLTRLGETRANQIRDERPPIWYWYKEFYTETAHSKAYTDFCEQLYGKNLCQANFSDMDQLEALIRVTDLNHKQRVLDLGCGTGLIAEYLSDTTGARVSGMDYSPEAIRQAQERTINKRDRLSFRVGNLDNLEYPENSFDTIISIDTLYMPNNLDDTMRRMKAILTPEGQMAIFYIQFLWDSQGVREILLPDKTPVAQLLRKHSLEFRTWDFTEATYRHMQRKRQIAEAMKSEFEAEGNLSLYNYLVTESESSTAPFNPETTTMSRYLYHVTT